MGKGTAFFLEGIMHQVISGKEVIGGGRPLYRDGFGAEMETPLLFQQFHTPAFAGALLGYVQGGGGKGGILFWWYYC